MQTEKPSEFTDRQARAVIVAAEARGFEREPDLYAWWYDRSLHEDAHHAAAYLRARDYVAFEAAIRAPDPVPSWAAADRITNEGRVSLADVRVIIQAAADRGYAASENEILRAGHMAEFDQARPALAFLWDNYPNELSELLGDAVLLAPLPETAISRCITHRYAGPLPEKADGREQMRYDW